MQGSLTRWIRSLRRQDGVTMIEMLVVILILATISLVSVFLVTSLFDSNIRAGQYLAQQNQIEQLYGFAASRMSSAKQSDFGLTCQQTSHCGSSATAIDPLTLSGDQIVFTSSAYENSGSSTGVCYRLVYVQSSREIDAYTAPDCATIAPQSGPNQVGGPADPTLNGSAGTKIVLAKNVTLPQGTTAPFTLTDASATPISGIYATANSNNAASSPYNDAAALRQTVSGLKLNSSIGACNSCSPQVRSRDYSQLFSIQQVCAAGGPGGQCPAPQFVTSLPASPTDGQEVYYSFTSNGGGGSNGGDYDFTWHLRYDASGGSYKWEFLGGPPLSETCVHDSGTLATKPTYLGNNGNSGTIFYGQFTAGAYRTLKQCDGSAISWVGWSALVRAPLPGYYRIEESGNLINPTGPGFYACVTAGWVPDSYQQFVSIPGLEQKVIGATVSTQNQNGETYAGSTTALITPFAGMNVAFGVKTINAAQGSPDECAAYGGTSAGIDVVNQSLTLTPIRLAS